MTHSIVSENHNFADMRPGTFLTSTALLNDTFFEGAVIYIAEYNSEGALGFVINRPFTRGLHELEEFSHLAPFPLFVGGPVDQEHLYFLHKRPDLIPGGVPVADGVYLGGDFSAAVQHIKTGLLGEKDLKVCLGYCGWDAGELEAELAEGSWRVGGGGDHWESP